MNDRPQEFRLNAEVVDGTVLLSRWIDWEARTSPLGLGVGWEEACINGGTGRGGKLAHKRAVGYTLGGLRLCVSSMINARIPEPGDGEEEGNKAAEAGEGGQEQATEIRRSQEKEPEEITMPTGHRMVLSGTFAPQSSILQLKSGTVKAPKEAIKRRALPQMWFSRTPLLCTGLRKDGIFVSLSISNFEAEGAFQEWQEENSDSIAKIAKTLYALRATMASLAGAGGRGRFAIICRRPRGKVLVKTKLEVYGMAEEYGFGLPEDLVEKLRGTGESEVGDSQLGLQAALEGLVIDDEIEQKVPATPDKPMRRGFQRWSR